MYVDKEPKIAIVKTVPGDMENVYEYLQYSCKVNKKEFLCKIDTCDFHIFLSKEASINLAL